MKIGILGGGQLGLMLAESLAHLGAEVWVLDPDPDSPARARLSNVMVKPFDDTEALAELFSRCDAVTFDSENVPAEPLAPHAAKLFPSIEVLRTSQDRGLEKAFLSRNKFPCVRHHEVSATDSLYQAVAQFGLPCIAKSCRGGYDGKGQHRLTRPEDVNALPERGQRWVLEEVISLETELSCIVARGHHGEELSFPTFENLHRDHVLEHTLLPARVEPELEAQAQNVARQIARSLDVRGLLTVEFFVGRAANSERALFVNELAPRTHNSGHVTARACSFSQFDVLARFLCGLTLHAPTLHPGAFCMGNLLGDVWLAQQRTGGPLDLTQWRDFREVIDVYEYGKREARPKRKMAHFVVHAATPERALERAQAFRSALKHR